MLNPKKLGYLINFVFAFSQTSLLEASYKFVYGIAKQKEPHTTG
jgi:hypothetical protein